MTNNMTSVSRRDRRRQNKPSLTKAMASNAGTFGRGAAAAVVASGLVLSSAVAANAGTGDVVPESTTWEAAPSSYSPERASTTAAPAAVTGSQWAEQFTAQSQTGASPQAQGNIQVASFAPAQTEAPASNGGNGSIVGAAYAGVGNPYSYGGTSTSGWDCSGFINWAYSQAGLDVPRTTYGMMASMSQVDSPSPGDIVIQNGGSHAAIYVGNGQLIGANNPEQGTTVYSADSPYWSTTMYLSPN
ncbi:C40 family peptidase [Nesterenkonia sp. CF4.4]|uniref:C40 family peptidase n=1 Tax=Nesterenkonia sp. CF4.4 TaxID=3373079 RepID=UPI003EE4DA18